MQKFKIISRNSELALVQAAFVKEKISELYPELDIEIIGITTKGDKILNKSLDKIGGKGLFIKELEQELLKNNADLAVHSLKDLPVVTPDKFVIPAILKRYDPSDAFISNKYNRLEDMPDNSIIGTSSPRRIALLKKYFPQLSVKLLRGNIQTRLARLDNGEFDGVILATAGIMRLGLEARIKQKLDVNTFIPAIGQGALALEILATRLDLLLLLNRLEDCDTYLTTLAEQEVGRLVGASCNLPIGVYAQISGQNMHMRVIIANNDTGKSCSVSLSDHKDNYSALAQKAVNQMASDGLSEILASEKVI